jgi:uncharacterized membrane protein YeaQ/YmgE (transglycosylase-associated protein family)
MFCLCFETDKDIMNHMRYTDLATLREYNMTNLETVAHRKKAKLILISLCIYVVWTVATYLLEGRIHLLQKIDVFGRFEYAIVANMIIGTVVAIWLISYYHIPSKFVSVKQMGFQQLNRKFITIIVISSLLGFGLFIFQRPASLNPIVIFNIFAQTLPVSIAEVVVCWGVVGTSFESILLLFSKSRTGLKGKEKNKKASTRIIAAIVGAVVATVLFGAYHFAHSPPFNQLNTVLFLMIPGTLTSIVYFIGRNIYVTVIFHNFQALYGVMRSIDIISFNHLLYPLLIMASISILILIVADLFLVRRQIITSSTNNKNCS